jgi:hypothetical protein
MLKLTFYPEGTTRLYWQPDGTTDPLIEGESINVDGENPSLISSKIKAALFGKERG